MKVTSYEIRRNKMDNIKINIGTRLALRESEDNAL